MKRYKTSKNYHEWIGLQAEEQNECCKCKSIIMKEDMFKKSNNGGFTTTDTCPKCGSEEFYVFKELKNEG